MLSKNPTMPSNKADFVNCQTSQLCATFCMKSPALESNAPINKSRKLRWRNERRVWKRTRRSISSDGEQRCSLEIRKFSCQASDQASFGGSSTAQQSGSYLMPYAV